MIGICSSSRFGQLANNATLCLAAQTQQDDVVSREDRIYELRNNGLVIADDSRKEFFAPLAVSDQVRAQLIFDRDAACSRLFSVRRELLIVALNDYPDIGMF